MHLIGYFDNEHCCLCGKNDTKCAAFYHGGGYGLEPATMYYCEECAELCFTQCDVCKEYFSDDVEFFDLANNRGIVCSFCVEEGRVTATEIDDENFDSDDFDFESDDEDDV